MPIYEYKCKQCSKVSEFLVGVTQEQSDIKCPSCGSTDLQRILSRSFVASGEKGSDACESCEIGNSCSCKGACNH